MKRRKPAARGGDRALRFLAEEVVWERGRGGVREKSKVWLTVLIRTGGTD